MIYANRKIDLNKVLKRQEKFITDWDSKFDKTKLKVLNLKAFWDPEKDIVWDEKIDWKLIEKLEGTNIRTRLQNSLDDYFLKKYSVELSFFKNEHAMEIYLDESALNNLLGYGMAMRGTLEEYFKEIGLPH